MAKPIEVTDEILEKLGDAIGKWRNECLCLCAGCEEFRKTIKEIWAEDVEDDSDFDTDGADESLEP